MVARRRKEVRDVTVPSLRKLADALGCGLTTVRRYASRGLVVPAPDGDGYDVKGTRAAIRRAKRRGELETAVLGRGETPDIRRLRARILEERGRLLELERRRKEGELVEVAEVERVVGGMIIAARTKILATPQRLRQRFPELPVEALCLLDGFLREALEELASDEAVGMTGDPA